MSKSRVFKVPDDLHSNVEKAYMDFCIKNPVLSMGADERRVKLKEFMRNADIAAAVEFCSAAPPWASDLGFDPDDALILRSLHQTPEAFEFLRLVRGWPRSYAEQCAFARRAKYSVFVAQYMRQGLGTKGTHHPSYSEGTENWDPSTARTIARKAFL